MAVLVLEWRFGSSLHCWKSLNGQHHLQALDMNVLHVVIDLRTKLYVAWCISFSLFTVKHWKSKNTSDINLTPVGLRRLSCEIYVFKIFNTWVAPAIFFIEKNNYREIGKIQFFTEILVFSSWMNNSFTIYDVEFYMDTLMHRFDSSL